MAPRGLCPGAKGGTVKYVRRKFFREYRKYGLPFMAAQRLARLRAIGGFACELQAELHKEGFVVEVLTFCDCCGPEVVRLLKDEKTWDLHYFSLAPC